MKSPTTRLVRTLLPTLVLSLLAALLAAPLMSSRRRAPEPPAPGAQAHTSGAGAREAYGRVPLSFEADRGQTDASVNFLARGDGYALFLRPAEAVFALRRSDAGTRNGERVLRMRLVGADASAAAAGEDELAGKANYLVGDDPSGWRTEVPTYARVSYGEVYPGVDLVYYGNQRQLEYDFRVAPGADPRGESQVRRRGRD